RCSRWSLRCLPRDRDRVRNLLPAIESPELDLAGAQEAEEEQEDGVLTRQQSLRLRAAAKLLVDALERVGRPQRLPLRGREAQEGEELVPRLLEARDHRRAAQAPLLREGGARLLDRLARLPVDHPPVVLGDLLPHPRRPARPASPGWAPARAASRSARTDTSRRRRGSGCPRCRAAAGARSRNRRPAGPPGARPRPSRAARRAAAAPARP